MTVPSGAVTAEITLTAAVTAAPPSAAHAVTGGAVDLGPEGTTFETPVTVNLTYADENVPAGVDASELRMFTVVDDAWMILETTSVNTTTKTVSGETSHFSTFGMLGIEVDGVTLTPAASDVSLGTPVQLTGLAFGSGIDLPLRMITYSSDDEGVATVDADGLVTPVAAGMATITASHDTGTEAFNATATVTVTLPVTTVTVTPATSDILVDGTVQLMGTTLGPTLKRKIRKSLGSNGAPNGQDNALSMQVCDPTLVAMLPTLGAQIAQAPDFGEMTKLFKGNGNDMTSLAVIKTLWSSGAKRGL